MDEAASILIPSSSAASTLGEEDWKREAVNGTHSHTIKGLKPGTSYRVRVVARDGADVALHKTNEVLVTVPGEAACLSVDALLVFYCFVSPVLCLSVLSHH